MASLIGTKAHAFTAGVPQVIQRLIQDAHDNTWFTVPHCDSRPGSPLADIAFNTMMSDLQRILQAQLDQVPELSHAWHMLGLHVDCVSWVDDLAIPVVVSPGGHDGSIGACCDTG